MSTDVPPDNAVTGAPPSWDIGMYLFVMTRFQYRFVIGLNTA